MMSLNCPKGDEHCIRGCKPWECRDGWPDEPPLKPDIAALKKRMADDAEFAATVTGGKTQNKPLRRGVDGVCTRSTCECERDGLGNQCVWLKPAEAEFECLGEPSLCANPRGCGCVPGCKTPAGCRENGCLGWCDEHRPEEMAGVEDLQREVARLKVENARLAEETMRLQRMLNAAHQIAGELARPSGI